MPHNLSTKYYRITFNSTERLANEIFTYAIHKVEAIQIVAQYWKDRYEKDYGKITKIVSVKE